LQRAWFTQGAVGLPFITEQYCQHRTASMPANPSLHTLAIMTLACTCWMQLVCSTRSLLRLVHPLQAVALHLLATLLSADKSSTVLAEVCHREKVPKALLDSVVAHAEGVVMQHSSKAQVRWLSLNTQVLRQWIDTPAGPKLLLVYAVLCRGQSITFSTSQQARGS
jgi:hypothetical protein